MLISETRFTLESYLRIHKYTIYHTNHSAGTARGGTAIIIKTAIKHHPLPNNIRDYIQSTSVSVEDSIGHLAISAVYLPPKHKVCAAQLEDFFLILGPRFIASGDYNAKHNDWRSRLITPRGRELFKTLERNNLAHLSTGHPTYWPSDTRKTPDLVDFCVTKDIPPDFAVAHSCLDLSSDHSPILVSLSSTPIHPDPQQ
jgi:endonuclease/exonuclease/phosphatase family metal-dependent hydrolase